VTPREAALVAFGPDAVLAYERVKTFYTRYGHALERTFADRVDGRVGGRGEPDVVTRLGAWEFCAAANTKNSAGDAAQLAKVEPGHVVQVSGTPRRGRISGAVFLALHGIKEPARAAGECEVAALQRAKVEAVQLALDEAPA
jgi:hypothetical protein